MIHIWHLAYKLTRVRVSQIIVQVLNLCSVTGVVRIDFRKSNDSALAKGNLYIAIHRAWICSCESWSRSLSTNNVGNPILGFGLASPMRPPSFIKTK